MALAQAIIGDIVAPRDAGSIRVTSARSSPSRASSDRCSAAYRGALLMAVDLLHQRPGRRGALRSIVVCVLPFRRAATDRLPGGEG